MSGIAGQGCPRIVPEEEKKTLEEIENIKLDKLTAEYLTEIKKSDADEEAAKWQLYYYLYVLKIKGIVRKGRLWEVQDILCPWEN